MKQTVPDARAGREPAIPSGRIHVVMNCLLLSENTSTLLGSGDSGGMCHLLFSLDGAFRLVGFNDGPCNDLFVESGCCGFVYDPVGGLRLASAAEGFVRVIGISVPRQDLSDMLARGGIREALIKAEKQDRGLKTAVEATPAMHFVLQSLAEAGAHGKVDGLFCMAKAMDLLWLFSRMFYEHRNDGICGRDLQAARQARSILKEEMAAPPPLKDLAARVGMSLSKLKQVFPRTFGLTPYAYLRRSRMERALYLLRSTELRVIEVAFEVGYASPSQFSRAFFDRFGCKPSQARKPG
jgi:AraC-like DNA-binding protein